MHRALEDPGRVSLVLAKQGGKSLVGLDFPKAHQWSAQIQVLFFCTRVHFSHLGMHQILREPADLVHRDGVILCKLFNLSVPQFPHL